MPTTTNPSPNNNPEENPMNDTTASTTAEQRITDHVIGTVEAKTPADLEIGDVGGLSDAGTVMIDLLVTALRNYRRAHENYISTMSAIARTAAQEVEWYRKGYGPTGLAPQAVHDAATAKTALLAAASTARDTATAAGMVLFPEAK